MSYSEVAIKILLFILILVEEHYLIDIAMSKADAIDIKKKSIIVINVGITTLCIIYSYSNYQMETVGIIIAGLIINYNNRRKFNE